MENAGDTAGKGMGKRRVRRMARRIVYGTARMAIIKRRGRKIRESRDRVGVYDGWC